MGSRLWTLDICGVPSKMSTSCTVVPPRLASQVLLKGSKEMEFTEHEIGTVGSVVHNFPAAVGPVGTGAVSDFLNVDHLSRSWLSGDLWKMMMWRKLSPPGYRSVTPIFCMPGYKPWWHGGTYMCTHIKGDDLEVWCISSAHVTLHLMLKLRISEVIAALLCMPSWHMQGQLYFSFTCYQHVLVS
jgi:hypothetical protein